MSGSADEMGAFVKDLIHTLEVTDEKVLQALADKQAILMDMDKALIELDELKQQDAKSKSLIQNLRSEVSKLSSSGGALSQVVSAERANLGFGVSPELQKMIKDMQNNEHLIKQVSALFPRKNK